MFLIFCAAGMWLARDRPHFTRVVGGGVLRLNAQPPSPPQHQQQQQLEQQQQQPPETYLPLALAHVLVCATFHWNVQKLIYLEMLLRTAATYRTRVDALLVTDSARSLEAAIGLWDGSFKPEPKDTGSPKDNMYWLLWEHKQAVAEALERQNYTAVVYMEDDTRLTWPALLSWALDTEALEPLNLTRCIYRTEVDPGTGQLVMLDWWDPVSVAAAGSCPLELAPDGPAPPGRGGGRLCDWGGGGGLRPCTVLGRYLPPPMPFQGMFIATRRQLDRWMKHDHWPKRTAVNATLPKTAEWGYAERSSSLNNFIDVPIACVSKCMVPFELQDNNAPAAPALSPLAHVEHMRNGYSSNDGSRFGTLLVAKAVRA